ncbi:hypothetical protein P692DRAFT_20834031, partial [Suillus brevipes Sb2]
MHVSFATVLAVAAALISSTSAVPVDPAAQKCPVFCRHDNNCNTCNAMNCFLLICSV